MHIIRTANYDSVISSSFLFHATSPGYSGQTRIDAQIERVLFATARGDKSKPLHELETPAVFFCFSFFLWRSAVFLFKWFGLSFCLAEAVKASNLKSSELDLKSYPLNPIFSLSTSQTSN